jgi:RNA polymerase sigma-70 factor (ECF subfamily)
VDLDEHLPLVAAGDPRAFERFIAGAERPLRQSLRSFAARVDVEAVLQEALLRTWQVAPRVERDGQPNALLRMSLRIARNLAIDEARRARAVGIDEADLDRSMLFAVTVAPPDPLLRAAIVECERGLPPKPAQVLRARLGATEPDAAIAARLGLRTNTFLQSFTRARKLLADCLQNHGVDLGELA